MYLSYQKLPSFVKKKNNRSLTKKNVNLLLLSICILLLYRAKQNLTKPSAPSFTEQARSPPSSSSLFFFFFSLSSFSHLSVVSATVSVRRAFVHISGNISASRHRRDDEGRQQAHPRHFWSPEKASLSPENCL